MIKKILKTLVNNLGFKILAVFFAAALWLIVYNTNDPIRPQTYTVYVTTENEQAIEDMGLYFTPTDESRQIKFSVSAKKTDLEKLEASDFTAVADMSKIELSEDGKSGKVEIDIRCSKSVSSLTYTNKTFYYNVAIEDLMTKNYNISASASGEVASGYALGDVAISSGPNMVKISGPESVVSQIKNVVATIDVSGMSTNVSDNVVPVPYDELGRAVDTTRLTFSVSTVTISANILNTKVVALNFTTTGTPAENYYVMGVESDPKTIVIKGTSSVLNPIAKIDIPAEVLDVTDATADIVTTVDVTEYLPAGTALYRNTDATVSVQVTIEAYTTREFVIPTANLSVEGLGSAYTSTFPSGSVSIPISGMLSDLDKLKESDITGSVNVSGMEDGNHSVGVSLNLDADKYDVAESKTVITIAEKPKNPAGGTEGNGTGSENQNPTGGGNGSQDSNGQGNTNGTTGGNGESNTEADATRTNHNE